MRPVKPWITVPIAAEVFSALNQPIPIPTRVRGEWLLTGEAYAVLDQLAEHHQDGD